ncbi:MAG: NACHT domain-containing protein [Gemmataceae bacterium]
MPKQSYPWKRFWYPRSADFRLSDRGYLSDPDGEYGKILNPDAVSFDQISDVPCLILLGEPGIGKSTALQASLDALKFDLGSFQTDANLEKEVFQNPQVQAWRDETQTLTLVLDSLDEGRLAISNIVRVLLREFQQLKESVDRLHLRIACRTADWPNTLEDGLKELWGEKSVSIYQLAPLRRHDVLLAAKANDLDPDLFLREVEHREAIPFAIKPITLEFLLNCFKRHQSFPATKAALYLEGCRGLCEETDARRDSGWTGELSADSRLAIAARIAALTMFGGFSAVWKGPELGDVPDGDISLRRLSGGTEPIKNVDVAINEHQVMEVLGTGLFSARGANRLNWSHYTYSEFLAAHYLVVRNFTASQAMGLLTLPDDKDRKLAPQLHETAAWLASMRPEFFSLIMATDPSVLLLSDVATSDNVDRKNLVETLLKLYDEEKRQPWSDVGSLQIKDNPRQQKSARRQRCSIIDHPLARGRCTTVGYRRV